MSDYKTYQSFSSPVTPTPPSSIPVVASQEEQSLHPNIQNFDSYRYPSPPTIAYTIPELTRRKLPFWALATLSVLLLISVGTGAWLTYYAGFELPAQADAMATATIQAATTTAKTQATQTAQSHINATATVSTQATAQVQQTATALQGIYNQATSGVPTFQSPLAAQDSANWEIYNAQGGGGCFFADGALHASVQRQNYYVPCFALASNFADMVFEVEMTITSGDEGGIIFRGDNTASKFYYFRVGRDGIAALYATQSNNESRNLFYDRVDTIKKGINQTNIVTIIARASTISLYINKQYVGQTQDTTYTSGQIGLLASDLTNATDVAYTNARVWQL
ncbi:family 16 glycoside hydrolase [Ktedonospora formicarum]|uniref:3-keto-alpha-glucoside-1,2-lyase/3-keto-2-hydroxy-glucal hydratase domain-containing protein n=1 Tax=Ktedonospora formicarum TaxID=2778364 RepID=A0A8J3HYD6_9CHLR|nr:family 16 glycoside hydrolase [Ktedonospora formicarum]GHO43395.1 hypothetical protein KSX_15580 [Ktedonospora formicarum]